jgi:hypothetical protein
MNSPSPLVICLALGAPLLSASGIEVTGKITDRTSGAILPARLVIESLDGEKTRHLAASAATTGSAVTYDKRRSDGIVEVHTALSAHPFKADLAPGRYRLTASRGHEYRPDSVEIAVPATGTLEMPMALALERWIDMGQRGWFSGDVHCHLPRQGLETVLLAADLNVTFPLAGWVTDSAHAPIDHNKVAEPWPTTRLQFADRTHVYYSANTEYELFTQNGAKEPLGALLILRHRDPLKEMIPPLMPMVEAARKQGAVFDLEKHNWPWSMILPAIGATDLFELANNHVWESGFGVTDWYTQYIPPYMGIPVSPEGEIDERGWLSYGFQNWYALLNCGLRIAPSAGTGAGVHPVALGFGRVYVRMPEREFDFDEWVGGLKAGRSMVTTGPMLFLTAAEKHPGSRVEWDPKSKAAKDADEAGGEGVPVICRVESEHAIESLELIVNGDPVPLEIGGPIGAKAAFSAMARTRVPVTRSSWIAARVFAKTPDGRPLFAHTAPVYIDVEDRPMRPKTLETNYLLDRVETEIKRHEETLSKEAKAEFEKAAEFYRKKRAEAITAEKSKS